MSAERRPRCGLAERVLSILTARTGPSAPVRTPVNGCVRAGVGVGVGDDGRGAAAAGGGDASTGPDSVEQAASAPAAATATAADVIRKQRTTGTSSDKSDVLREASR